MACMAPKYVDDVIDLQVSMTFVKRMHGINALSADQEVCNVYAFTISIEQKLRSPARHLQLFLYVTHWLCTPLG